MKQLKLLFLLLFSVVVRAQTYNKPIGDVILPPGNYDVVNLSAGKLTINEETKVTNFNNYYDVEIIVNAKLTTNNLHLNGNAKLKTNARVIVNGSIELQNGGNYLEIKSRVETIEFQRNDATSIVYITTCSGLLIVAGSLNLNDGAVDSFYLVANGRVITNNFNVNGTHFQVAGQGSIKFTAGNINRVLSQDAEVIICTSVVSSNFGNATRGCYTGCDELPVKLGAISIKLIDNNTIKWSVDVIDYFNNDSFIIKLSEDNVIYKDFIYQEIDKINPNKKYSGTFKLEYK